MPPKPPIEAQNLTEYKYDFEEIVFYLERRADSSLERGNYAPVGCVRSVIRRNIL